MIKRLISFLLTFVLLVAIPLEARYRYNPYTRKLDFYEAAGDIVLGDIGDITLTGLATGNILYYNGAAWVNLATGANTNVLTLAAGIPSWAAGGVPAAHAASHEVGGADLVDHDQLTGYLAAQHLTLPNTIVTVLTDHDLAAHTALGLFDASGDVDHNLTTNYLAAQHLTLPATIAAVLTDHDLAAHTALGLFDASADVDHDATTNWVANKHIDWTAATDELDITRATAPLIDLNPAFVGTGEVIDIAPSAVISVVDSDWAGMFVDGAALDPSVAGVELHGISIDLTDVDVTNVPHIEGLRILVPPTYHSERAHSIHANHGIFIDADISTLAAGETSTTLDIVYSDAGATGGDVHAMDVARAGGGTVGIQAIGTHTGVGVIHQHIGAITAFDQVWEYDNDGPGWTDITAACGNPAVDVAIWDDKDDEVYFGQATTFDEIVCVWNTAATKDMFFDFYYSVGAAAWTQFFPLDDTDGATIDASIMFLASDLAGWVVDTVNGVANKYWIRIERTRVSGTGPTEDTIKFIDGTTYEWDEDAQVTIKELIVNMTEATDQGLISQTAVAGIEDVPLIGIDDDRTGVTANEESEATIRIDADGIYALSLANGGLYLGGTAEFTLGTSINEFSIDGTLAGNSDDAVPTEKAVKTYVDAVGGDVTAGANLTDLAIVRGDGGAKGVKTSTALISDNGEMTNPSQPSFLVTHSGSVLNITGDGTAYDVAFDTEIVDQGGNFAANVFTASVDGQYIFTASITTAQTEGTSGTIMLITSNGDYPGTLLNPEACDDSAERLRWIFSGVVEMDATDTAFIRLTISGGAKVVDYFAADRGRGFFSGALLN